MDSKIAIHPLEATLLRALANQADPHAWRSFQEAEKISNLSPDQLRRAIEWLKSKNLLETREQEKTTYSLGERGRQVLGEGLPERKLVRLVESEPKPLKDLAEQLGAEFSVALGRARKNGWIRVSPNQQVIAEQAALDSKEADELLLDKLSAELQIDANDLSQSERETLSQLSKRQKDIIKEKVTKDLGIKLTDKGLDLIPDLSEHEIGEITPEVIRTKQWERNRLRPIDVASPAPNYYGGRKHPVRLFIEEVREAFVSLGFKEIRGSSTQSAFWNFDALFIPQHHSAREMQDTFYVSGVEAKVNPDSMQVVAVRASHEYGRGTGSLGWGKGWQIEEARKVVLRTHTTAVTVRYLADNRPEEARVFSVDKVYRNEKPNYKNSPEFYQIEGVMTAPGLNLRNLIFIISEFYSKLGFEKVKFWPTYFPYTEPSLQTVVYSEEKQRWMELGGMGVFRPEVTVPLGIKNPVLAWGLGMDRLVMMKYGLQDIRELFGANLGWLRKSGVL
jgi:phenylalanyl-tRNA synthetase alpha chain